MIELYTSTKPQLPPFAPAVDNWNAVRGEPLSKPCTLLWAKGRTRFSHLQGLRSSPEPRKSSVRRALQHALLPGCATRGEPEMSQPARRRSRMPRGQGCTRPWRMRVRTPLPAAFAWLCAGDKLLPLAVRVGTSLGVPAQKEEEPCLQATHQQSRRQSVGRRKISYNQKEESIRRPLAPNARRADRHLSRVQTCPRLACAERASQYQPFRS